MKLYTTELKALNKQGDLVTFMGMYVLASSFEEAQLWCDNNAGYLTVIGEFIAEIPIDDSFIIANNKIDISDIPKSNQV